METNPLEPKTQLHIDEFSYAYLTETARWAHFLSIVGFIGLGLMVLMGLLLGTVMDSFTGGISPGFSMRVFSFVYLVIAAIYVAPLLYLFRFSTQMKFALRNMNQESITTSFGNLKSLFRFMGIMMIVILSIYLIVLLSAMIFGVLFR